MRKVKIILPILFLFTGILLYLQFGRDVEVISTTSTTSDQFYEQGMTVVANKLIIPDKVAFAENLLDRTRRNDFKEVLFSYDVLGYPDRIKRLVETENITEKEAAELIERTDKKRAAYYNYYSMKTWGAASSYHLCMNSSMLGDEATADFIERFIREKLGLQ